MNEILFSMLLWLAQETNYDVAVDLPNVIMTAPGNLCEQYGIHDKGRCHAAGLVGFYDKHLTIYLSTDFDPHNADHQSNLFHELVHYIQWQNDAQNNDCLGRLEVEAYRLQDSWRTEMGLEPKADELKLVFLGASCDA